MRTTIEILLVFFLIAIGVLYYRSKQDNARIQTMVGYLSYNTREQIDSRRQYLDSRIRMVKCASEKSENPTIDSVLLSLEKFRTIFDSARILLRNIDSLKVESEMAAGYDGYKRWLYSKQVFFSRPERFKWLFNPILGLDKGLFPESLITIEHLNATHLSTLILEDELSIHLYQEAQDAVMLGGDPCGP